MLALLKIDPMPRSDTVLEPNCDVMTEYVRTENMSPTKDTSPPKMYKEALTSYRP